MYHGYLVSIRSKSIDVSEFFTDRTKIGILIYQET